MCAERWYALISTSVAGRSPGAITAQACSVSLTSLRPYPKYIVPPVGKVYFGYGHRLVSETEQARAVVAPGLLPTTDVDVNTYHRSAAHAHPRLLRETAKQQGVTLKPGIKCLPVSYTHLTLPTKA